MRVEAEVWRRSRRSCHGSDAKSSRSLEGCLLGFLCLYESESKRSFVSEMMFAAVLDA